MPDRMSVARCCCTDPTFNYCAHHGYPIFSNVHNIEGFPQSKSYTLNESQSDLFNKVYDSNEVASPDDGPWFADFTFRNFPNTVNSVGTITRSGDGFSASLENDEIRDANPLPPGIDTGANPISLPIRTARGFEVSIEAFEASWDHPDDGFQKLGFVMLLRRVGSSLNGFGARNFLSFSILGPKPNVDGEVRFVGYDGVLNSSTVSEIVTYNLPTGPVDVVLRMERDAAEDGFLTKPFSPITWNFEVTIDGVSIISKDFVYHLDEVEELYCEIQQGFGFSGDSISVGKIETKIIRNTELDVENPPCTFISLIPSVFSTGNSVSIPPENSTTRIISCSVSGLTVGNSYAVEFVRDTSPDGGSVFLSDSQSLNRFFLDQSPHYFYFKATSMQHSISVRLDFNGTANAEISANAYVVDVAGLAPPPGFPSS